MARPVQPRHVQLCRGEAMFSLAMYSYIEVRSCWHHLCTTTVYVDETLWSMYEFQWAVWGLVYRWHHVLYNNVHRGENFNPNRVQISTYVSEKRNLNDGWPCSSMIRCDVWSRGCQWDYQKVYSSVCPQSKMFPYGVKIDMRKKQFTFLCLTTN
jgi:hypothetical protein